MMRRAQKILFFYGAALIVGILSGVVGSWFQLSIDALQRYFLRLQTILTTEGIPGWIGFPIVTLIVVLAVWYWVNRFAPETAGSGVQEIEGALKHLRPIRFSRVLPVKFLGGALSIASSFVLGREGPTIQMGGNLGQAFGCLIRLSQKQSDMLVAAGAAAGLATAFNAPLAGVLFVMEEMKDAFTLSFLKFKTVAISTVAATIVLRLMIGNGPSIPMNVFEMPDVHALGLFFLLGILVGLSGIVFTRVLMRFLYWMDKLSFAVRLLYVASVALLVGFLAWLWPNAVGGGYHIIEHSLTLMPGFTVLVLLILVRFALTVLCYGTGVPGGLFAPLLALGTLLGLAVATGFELFLPDTTTVHPGMFAVAGMGALFSSTIRAPVTGIVLVVEMTQNYSLILPLMVSCLTATTVVQLIGGKPIYEQLLRRTLLRANAV